MDLRLLEIFCYVYESMSFSRAAEQLNLTQPTVSAHIRTLEEYFGTSLFDRLGREIQPTRAAKILYEQSSSLSHVRRDIENAMNRFLNKQEGRLQLGASTIPGEYLLPRMISQFRQKYPKIEVSVSIGDTRQIQERTLAGEIELGFIGATPEDSNLNASVFASDQLVLAVPVNKRYQQESVTLAELKKMPLIIRERGSGTRKAFELQLAEQRLALSDFTIIAELGSTAALKEAVIHDLGVAVISDKAIEMEQRFKLIRTMPVKDLRLPKREFHTIYNKRRQRSPLCELMLESIKNLNHRDTEKK